MHFIKNNYKTLYLCFQFDHIIKDAEENSPAGCHLQYLSAFTFARLCGKSNETRLRLKPKGITSECFNCPKVLNRHRKQYSQTLLQSTHKSLTILLLFFLFKGATAITTCKVNLVFPF